MPTFILRTAWLIAALSFGGLLYTWLTPEPTMRVEPKPEVVAPNLNQALDLWNNKQRAAAVNMLDNLVENSFDQNLLTYHFYLSHALNRTLYQFIAEQAKVDETCQQNLLLVASSLASLQQAEAFKAKFAKDLRFSTLPICLQPTVFFDPRGLKCEVNAAVNQRVSCDLSVLATYLKGLEFTHLVLFTEQGKAYVRNGIMFLDKKDSYDVFIHELAHFAGFADEYPLSKSLADKICGSRNVPNLRFARSDGHEVSLHNYPTDSLSKARTCDQHELQAYKLSPKLTFMEFHDLAYIPQSYKQAWVEQLSDRSTLPSAHVNFAQHYQDKDNAEESQFWWQLYQAYLKL